MIQLVTRQQHLLINSMFESTVCRLLYLLIGHELEGRLWGDFDDVDAVASPQRPCTALLDHLHQPAHDAHVVSSGPINLKTNKTE